MVRTRDVLAVFVVVLGVITLTGGLGYLAVTIDDRNADTEYSSQTDQTALQTETAIAELHVAGITGENVSVGVLDVTGFETDRATLGDQVVATRQFDETGNTMDGDAHGTATALTIARMVPDADLYLGTFETFDGYAAGLEWMLEQDVDVVVAPIAYAGTIPDGTSRLSETSTTATDRGLVIVAPAGNLGAGHWMGTYQPTDGIHTFEDETVNDIQGAAGRAEFWLTWDDPSEEYSLELHRLHDQRDETELLVRSVAYDGGNGPAHRLTVNLRDDQYGLVVRGPQNATGTTIRVASATHTLADGQPAQSVTAPASAPGVISVGAIDPATGDIEEFSSRGPTTDGRLGISVVAPASQPVGDEPFVGTSASAAFTGGVAALVLDVEPTLEPEDVRWLLATSADANDSVNPATGYGRIDPHGAIEEAADRDAG